MWGGGGDGDSNPRRSSSLNRNVASGHFFYNQLLIPDGMELIPQTPLNPSWTALDSLESGLSRLEPREQL